MKITIRGRYAEIIFDSCGKNYVSEFDLLKALSKEAQAIDKLNIQGKDNFSLIDMTKEIASANANH